MAHHKRGKRRDLRAGCKMCKPWKMNGSKTPRFTDSELRKLQLSIDDLEDVEVSEGDLERFRMK